MITKFDVRSMIVLAMLTVSLAVIACACLGYIINKPWGWLLCIPVLVWWLYLIPQAWRDWHQG